MRVLVTGGAGYIGSNMVLGLLDRGDEPVVLDSLVTGFREAVPDNVPFYLGDVADEALVGKIIADEKIEAIIHFAAFIVVPDSVSDPLGYYLNNTVKTRALIAAAVAGGVDRFVFSSTAAVYGTPEKCPVDESYPPNPESPYGTSKLMTEMILRDVEVAHGMRHAILRYFNVAGADLQMRSGQRYKAATHLIKVASQAATGQRESMSVFGTDYPTPDGTGVRDYIHITDLIGAHLVALDRLAGGGESFTANCGYGRGFSVLEVIDAVKRVSNSSFEVKMEPRRPGDAAEVVADASRMRSFGWQPQHDDLETIVRSAIDWETTLLD
ncbi:MAG TPA: UDP-glucose 4-epimerase GalE [Rhizobiales bacterium]|nr:UDP-glucose 4-epimerase GalE [Hyphomicrobiales bacterium]